MADLYLVVSVRLLEPRYHGRGEWPPQPARLYQALVAAAAYGDGPDWERRWGKPLRWLERLKPPPLVFAPRATKGQAYTLMVPNNNTERGRGLVLVPPEIRTKKPVRPWILQRDEPLHYVWRISGDQRHQANEIAELASRIYQLGRGVDMAHGWGEVTPSIEALRHSRTLSCWQPTVGSADRGWSCPTAGTLDSLIRRHKARSKHRVVSLGRSARKVFQPPPPAVFTTVPYEAPPRLFLFTLKGPHDGRAYAWPLERAADLVQAARQKAAQRLLNAASATQKHTVEAALLGTGPAMPTRQPSDRVRLIPLPSVGHEHADRDIRRLLLHVPATSGLVPEDVQWALSGVVVHGPLGPCRLQRERTLDWMAEQYLGHQPGEERGERRWYTVTPCVLPSLPGSTGRQYGADQRLQRTRELAVQFAQALRHAGVIARPTELEIQREPFHSHEVRAEQFASGTRFERHRLWHVRVLFDRPVRGPLVVGDGRFLGLGVMVPARRAP